MSYTENTPQFVEYDIDNKQKISAGLIFNGNFTVTPMPVVGDWYDIVSPIPLVLKQQGSEFFNSIGNRLLYAGVPPIKRTVTAAITMVNVGSGTRQCEVAIFMNGAPIINGNSTNVVGGGFQNLITIVPNFDIVDTDYFEVKVRQLSGVQRNFIIEKMELIIN